MILSKSIFTQEIDAIRDKGPIPFPTVPDINTDMQGILDLLTTLYLHIANGHDSSIQSGILKEKPLTSMYHC